jgi:hypothetical protein
VAWSLRQTLIGCGLGCVVVLVLGIGSCVGFYVWLQRPGELLEPERLLGADTAGYVEWTLRLEDPGTRGFVETLVELQQRQMQRDRAPLPGWIRQFLQRQTRRGSEEDLRELLPLVAAWTVRPGAAPGTDLHVVTLSLKQVGNRMVFLDWILSVTFRMSDKAQSVSYLGETIYQLPAGEDGTITFFIRGNDLFFTSDVETAQQALYRLQVGEPQQQGAATELDRWFDGVRGQALRGAVVNERGELTRVLERLTDESFAGEPWSALRAATVSGGLTAEGAFDARVEFHGPDAGWAAAGAEPLAELLRRNLDYARLPVELGARAEGERIVVELRTTDLAALLERLAEEDRDASR